MRYVILFLTLFLPSGAFAQYDGLDISNGAIEGEVVDERKEPIIGLTVACFVNGERNSGTITDVNGGFLLKPLKAGTYELGIQKDAHWYGIRDVKIGRNNIRQVHFKLSSGSPFQGYFSDTLLKRFYQNNISISFSKKLDPDKFGVELIKGMNRRMLGCDRTSGIYSTRYVSLMPLDPGPYVLYVFQVNDRGRPDLATASIIRNIMLNTDKDTELNIVLDK